MLRVIVIEAWLSISETTLALTPSLKSGVAQVFHRSWKRRSSREALASRGYTLEECFSFGELDLHHSKT